MFLHETTIRVRYGETDQMGVVYYGNYALYFEIGRVEALRYLGVPYKELEQTGIIMPVIDMQVQYLAPARYDDLIRIETRVNALEQSKIVFEHNLFLQNSNVAINKAKTTLVFVKLQTKKPTRMPAKMFAALAPFFHEKNN